MPMITFHDLAVASRTQTLAWLEAISADLRPGDRDEIRATNPLLTIGEPDALLLLTMSVMNSTFAWVICDDDMPICVFGAAPTDEPSDGCIWMIGTPGMEGLKAKFVIARRTPAYLKFLHRRWRRLSNHVDARNITSIQWLLWNGFDIEAVDLRHGRETRPFYLITSIQEEPQHL